MKHRILDLTPWNRLLLTLKMIFQHCHQELIVILFKLDFNQHILINLM